MINSYKKMNAEQKQNFNDKFSAFAEVAPNERQIAAADKKAQRRSKMLKALKKDAEIVSRAILNTYGKGKSDSKPSELMQKVIDGLKDITTDMSDKEFKNKISTLQTSIDDYIEKRGYPGKKDRIERMQTLHELRRTIADYKNERKGQGRKNS